MKYNHTIKDVKEMNAKYVDIYIYSGEKSITDLTEDDMEWVSSDELKTIPDWCECAVFDKADYEEAGFFSWLEPEETALVVVIPYMPTFDVHFDNEDYSSSKGWAATYKECLDYIRTYNGTDESYFADYKGGVVSISCNESETGAPLYEERIQ